MRDVQPLNTAQQAAVDHVDGPLLVVAGAGSGKTRVLTHRIANLIGQHDVHPYQLLAITFTNKAAGEMADRVGGLLDGSLSRRAIGGMWVTTFHKACVRILRREIARLGYGSDFTIYDQLDAQRLIAMISKELSIDDKRLSPRAIQGAISRAKDQLVDFDTYRSQANSWPEADIAEVYTAYQQRLLQANALDFDDLIVKAVEVLQLFDDVRATYQQRFRYVLIDEYQDTNRAQYHLVNLLTESHRNLMVVGDPQQGVYSFRGATIQNILDFERDHPDAQVIVLDRNYRSSQTILDAANHVIARSGVTTRAQLWTERGAGEPVVRYRAEDEHDEAAFVAAECQRLADEGVALDDIAIFYRTNAQSRVLEDVFIRLGLRYRIVGGLRFYERKEIKDVLAYAKLMLNPHDDVAARRIINTPRRAIGDRTVEEIDLYARRQGLGFLEACRQAEEIPGIAARAVGAVQAFVDLLDGMRTALEHDLAVPDLIEMIWDRTGYLRELQAERSEEALFREENLRELKSVAQEVHERGDTPGGVEGLAEFLESVTLVSDQDELAADDSEPEPTVTMMTLHTAKGLEYPVVFLVGLEDGVFPHVRSLSDPDQLEEERRLCYVGFTRAQDRLYVSHADHRMLWGGASYNPPSRFLDDVPAELIEERRGGDRRNGSGWDLGASHGRAGGGGRGGAGGAGRAGGGRGGAGGAGGGLGGGRGGEAGLGMIEIDGAEFHVGDRVLHTKFGPGRLVELSGEGERAQATVEFDQAGVKHLMLAYAPLVRL